ncbi:MAG: flagellar biosynthesis protein FlhA [Candidatus Poribacteria bacterium]|nr:MAG: flagellar biosynthesis protein FlhA [Candidatus Poribacteria bacterium]
MRTVTPTGAFVWTRRNAGVMIGAAVLGILLMLFVPLPPLALDFLIATNLTLAVFVLMISLFIRRPLDFSAYPTLLLILTIYRLALNVVSTRLILSRGEEIRIVAGAPTGLENVAGRVINAIGAFVMRGNPVVGIVIFVILVVIQFVVITRGASRIAEVSARFTLDAMPGKQMAIDADLNAGLIDEETARRERRRIQEEADFYAAMDGASRFVRGDAVAGVLITLINIIGGLIIGTLDVGLTLGQAFRSYSLLTVGDGLVAQIPALLLSTSAGIIVTRGATADEDFGQDLGTQALRQPQAIAVTAIAVLLIGLALTGAGKTAVVLPFLLLSGVIGLIAYRVMPRAITPEEAAPKVEMPSPLEELEKLEYGDVVQPHPIELMIGYSLLPLVDTAMRGSVPEKIARLRREFALERGFLIPKVRIRDNARLKPNQYAILIHGTQVAEGELMPSHFLAMDAGGATAPVDGIEVREPAFGLPALWISADRREEAELAGYTVVDPATVLTTHLKEVIRQYAHELLGRQEVQEILETVKKTHPVVVEELIPDALSIGGVQKVLQNLLREGVSIKNITTILEALADYAPQEKDLTRLTELVRQSIGRQIVEPYLLPGRVLPVFTLDPALENALVQQLRGEGPAQHLALEADDVQRFMEALGQTIEAAAPLDTEPILLCLPQLRPHLRRLTEPYLPNLVVISYNEVPAGIELRSLGTVQMSPGR